MIELSRWRCPLCDTVADVWLEDGRPESPEATLCPDCSQDGYGVVLMPEAEEMKA